MCVVLCCELEERALLASNAKYPGRYTMIMYTFAQQRVAKHSIAILYRSYIPSAVPGEVVMVTITDSDCTRLPDFTSVHTTTSRALSDTV